jgi:hypothetical protein
MIALDRDDILGTSLSPSEYLPLQRLVSNTCESASLDQSVLQDLPGKVAHATCSAEVQRVVHDFFTPQSDPSRCVRVYYLHSIIHNWNDSYALKILRHITSVIFPGYSKLLINDVLRSLRETPRRDTSVYVDMMAKLGGREMTDGILLDLVERLGLRVERIWSFDLSQACIREAELPLLS